MPTPPQPLSEPTGRRARITVRRLRWLILTVLAVALLAFTAGVMLLVQQIFDNFGPAVRKDLEWQAGRGAQELARGADLGLAVNDRDMVTEAFGDFRSFKDVIAVVALNSAGKVVAEHGSAPEPVDALFAGPEGVVRSTPRYLVAWAAATIEGSNVGKVALVISTRRLVESQALLRRISLGTAAAAALALLCGIIFVNFFTGTIAARDAQLAAYAADLEKKIAERTAELDGKNREMRLVFDHVEQGLLAVSMDGVMRSERSTIVDQWFGVPATGARFADYIRASDPMAADWFSMGLDALCDGILPEELLLDQLPKRMTRGQHTLRLAYTPISGAANESGRQLLVVMTDVTDELARERMERDTQEMMRIFQRTANDRAGVQQFFAEADHLVRDAIEEGAGVERDLRVIHTLKGNCGQLGLDSMVELCHDAETEMQEDRQPLGAASRQRIGSRWQRLVDLARFAWDDRRAKIEIDEEDLQRLMAGLRARMPQHELMQLAESWRLEPVALRFSRLAEKARYICERLGKPAVTIHADAGGLRLDSGRWAPFWAALVHAINNALDHGIEHPEARLAGGKASAGTLWLTARQELVEGRLAMTVSVRDDGNGLDWERLAAQASARGLAHATREDLIEAMYVEGVSTREQIGVYSGRGVGLAALRQATDALGGEIEVHSESGLGTTLLFRFPISNELKTIAA
jgi:HPt (histidine-containing phosphotransfer) domain-containing protein/two-component sensor histidine kinase